MMLVCIKSTESFIATVSSAPKEVKINSRAASGWIAGADGQDFRMQFGRVRRFSKWRFYSAFKSSRRIEKEMFEN